MSIYIFKGTEGNDSGYPTPVSCQSVDAGSPGEGSPEEGDDEGGSLEGALEKIQSEQQQQQQGEEEEEEDWDKECIDVTGPYCTY